jgi:ABC-type nitrate/sulfonate/bicarbonate transport system substrate-binding protein
MSTVLAHAANNVATRHLTRKGEFMRKLFRSGVLALVLALPSYDVPAQQLTEINASSQAGLYWALPFYIATQKGWWAEIGLKANFTNFPAGVPQIAAAAAKSWDVGGTGAPPAVLGAVRFNIITIAIGNDESQNSGLFVRGDKAEQYIANPSLLKGQTILVPANSTADESVQGCLAKFGLKKADVTLKNMGPEPIISAISSGQADLSGLWAPYMYILQENGSKVLCTGKDAGVVVPANIVARADYAKEHPQEVAKFLAVYLRGWRWAKAHRKDAIDMLRAFNKQSGVTLSDVYLNRDFDSRPVYDLAGQLRIMNRASGSSEVDGWFVAIGEFLKAGGAIAQAPAPKDYITDEFLKIIDHDLKLKEFANRVD